MTVTAVEHAIGHARNVIQEWEKIGEENWPGENSWREDQTRYAVIDPVIRALEWDTAEPRECYIEYHRPHGTGRVDYALFRQAEMADAGRGTAVPDIIIEAKSVHSNLDDDLPQLQNYVRARPAMTEGVAALTNGGEWRLYRVDGRRNLSGQNGVTVDVLNDEPEEAARTLWSWLGKPR